MTDTVLIVGHGQTEWNRMGRQQGWAPVPLNKRGQKQARQLGKYLKEEHQIDCIFSSDLRRCRETTEIIVETLSVTICDVMYNRDIRERNLGVLQGLDQELTEEFSQYFLPAGGNDAVSNKPENGESYSDLQSRVIRWWTDIVSSLNQYKTDSGMGKTYLIVTHGGPARVILGYINDLDIVKAFQNTPFDNCAINTIQFDGEEAKIVAQNDLSFH